MLRSSGIARKRYRSCLQTQELPQKSKQGTKKSFLFASFAAI
jgi:hypothetical protein